MGAFYGVQTDAMRNLHTCPVFRVECDELKKLLTERADYHAKRADEKEAVMPGLVESLDAIRLGSAPSSKLSNKSSSYRLDPEDVVGQAEDDIRDHRAKSQSYMFLAEHLVQDTYYLTLSELRELGIIKHV